MLCTDVVAKLFSLHCIEWNYKMQWDNSESVILNLIFAWPCIIDTNNIDSQLEATETVHY